MSRERRIREEEESTGGRELFQSVSADDEEVREHFTHLKTGYEDDDEEPIDNSQV